MCGLPSRRVLLVLLLSFTALGTSRAGLRDIHPRPQQMGLLASQPIVLSGTPYLVIPDNPSTDETLAANEAVRLLSERIGRTPAILSWSAYSGQSPAVWFGVLNRFPALVAALDSTGIAGMGVTSHGEEYQLVVQDGRVLVGGADTRGLRWAMMSLVELIANVMGRLYVDQAYIRDWPYFSKRIGTINSCARTSDQMDLAYRIADLSYGARMNEMECNLSEAGIRNTRPIYNSNMVSLSNRIRNRGQTLTMSADNTAHNLNVLWWQEGIPMNETVMRVTSSGFVPVADGYHVSMANGDFESWNGNRPTGWDMGRDDRFAYLSRDGVTVHSGQSSAKFTGFGPNTPGDVEVFHDVYLGPYRLMKVKFWYKLAGYRGQILLDLEGKHPPYNRYDDRVYDFNTPTTQDWTEAEFTFCSFNADTGLCMIGPWGPLEGTLWLDDITFETAYPAEMLRRSDTPVVVRKQGQGNVLTEGVDYQIVETYSSSYPQYVKQPRLDKLAGGALAYGDTVRMDWHCAMLYQGSRQTECFSLLEPLLAYQDRIAALDSLLHPDGFKIHIDEVSYTDYDPLCTARHMTPAQLVGSYCRQMYQIIQGRRPGVPVRIYGDPFDVFVYDVRAMPVTVSPWTIGSLQELPAPIEVMAMQDYSSNLDSSMVYFGNNGHPSVMAVPTAWPFGVFVDGVQAAKRHRQQCPGVEFYMWETDAVNEWGWRIPDFGDLAWNIGPYIVHTPLQFSARPDSIQTFAEMWTDSFHRTETPSLTNSTLYYRWLPSGQYSTMPLLRTGTDFYVATLHAVPPSATGIAYYLSVRDHRGETTTAPADAPARVFTAMFPLSGSPPNDNGGQVIQFSTRHVPGGVLMEWPRVNGIEWYEVHMGAPPNFGSNSRTRISRQQPACPRYLLTSDRADAEVPMVGVYGFSKHGTRKDQVATRKR